MLTDALPTAVPELDALDFRIIGQLHSDGRKSSTDIARALRVPRTTVARRIERLVRDRVITVGVFANGPMIGLPVHAMILLQVSPIRYEAVVSAVTALDEVRWVGILSGPFDLLIEAMLPSNEDLRHLLLNRLAKIEGVTQMQTAQVLEVAKIAFDWNRMLHVDRTAEAQVEPAVSPAVLRPVTAWQTSPGEGGKPAGIPRQRRTRAGRPQ